MSTRSTRLLPRERYEGFRTEALNLDLTRGKPSPEQLALSAPLLSDVEFRSRDGTDCRNYGGIDGLPEARELFGSYLGTSPKNTMVLGNSSLAVMHDLVLQMLIRGLPDESRRWDPYHNLRNRPVMLCPVPGYDRHFAICERYGIEMIPIPLNKDGPDMDAVEEVLCGPKKWRVFGMWCTPKYSNPSGVTYSPGVCQRLATMDTWAGFRIFWDLAYNVHDLTDHGDDLPNMLELCRLARVAPDQPTHANRVFIVGSTSKITFAGAGISMLAASEENLAWFREGLSVRTIGYDKLNQLRHVRFLKDMVGVRTLMGQHRAILAPKFNVVNEVLEQELGGQYIAHWNRPRGGYFVSLQTKHGCAKRVVDLAAAIGVKLTPAGAAFPYGNDPDDSHIRIAPTFPSLDQLRKAMEVVAVCVQIAASN